MNWIGYLTILGWRSSTKKKDKPGIDLPFSYISGIQGPFYLLFHSSGWENSNHFFFLKNAEHIGNATGNSGKCRNLFAVQIVHLGVLRVDGHRIALGVPTPGVNYPWESVQIQTWAKTDVFFRVHLLTILRTQTPVCTYILFIWDNNEILYCSIQNNFIST